jgi:RNA polymerase subunit RPABC4/transcription elongation factor Spt4
MKREAIYLFCDAYFPRYAIGDPWVKDGTLYATDGRIAIAIDADLPDTNDGRRRPNVEELLVEPKEWHPLPDELPEGTLRDGPCWYCLDYKFTPWNAIVCRAEPCPYCGDDELDEEWDEEFEHPIYSVVILGMEVSRYFIEKLRILLNGTPCDVGVGKADMLVFRWEGGRAALMVLKK